MKEAAFRALHKQFMFFSDNGTNTIDNPAIAMSEACKCCGLPREEMRKALRALEELGLVESIAQEKLQYTMTKSGTNYSHVETLIKHLLIS